MLRPPTALWFLLTLPCAAQDPAAPTATVLEMFSLEGLSTVTPEGSGLHFGSLLRRTEPHDFLRNPDGVPRLEPGELRDYLQNLQQAAGNEGRVELMLPGRMLVVRTTRELLPTVRQQLHEVLAVLLRPIAIDAAVYAWETDEPLRTTVSPTELAELLRGRTPLWSATAHLTSNQTAIFRQERWSSYARGIASEVAQKSDVAIANMDAFFEGIAANVEVHALAGSQDLVLFGQLALAARRGEPRSMPTGVRNQPNLDLPLLETSLGTFAGRVPSGGGLVCVSRGHPATGSRLLVVFTPRLPTPGSTQRLQNTGIFPVSAFTSTSLLRRVTPPVAGEDEADFGAHGGDEAPFGHLDPEMVLELVRTAAGPAGEDEHFQLKSTGGYLLVHGNSEQVAAVETTVRGLQDRLLQNFEVRCLATATEVRAAGVVAESPAGPATVLHDLAVPALPGRSVAWFRGLETNVIRNFQINVAQEASSVYPETALARSGLLISASCAPGASDPIANLLLHFQHVAEPTIRETKPEGNTMLTVTASRLAAHSGPIPAGKLVGLGQGPPIDIDGRPFHTALQTVVTSR